MANNRTFVVKHRRRREGKTDYRLRLSLLKSNKTRFVVRKSSNNIICQVVKYAPQGDIVLACADSRNLKGFGWTGHCGNLPSAYLTGLLCAGKAKEAGVSEAIPDFGLYANVKGSRVYAALKGAVDGGLSIPHSEGILPSKERIAGMHTKAGEKTAKSFEEVRKKIGK